ncbi:MAG TPA: substrate-binding domain-containing protein [Anaerolineales bacterium]|nr:substrate-binding domain-containing protein [Anaerolineales bacterium]
MSKKPTILIYLLVLLSLVLGACATPTTPAPTEPPAAAATEAPTEPVATEPPAAATEEPLAPVAGDQRIILATTTSTEDSGLLEVILPDFTTQTGIEVDVIAVGTGQALQLGIDGNADVLLVHARAREDEFMANGDGVRREEVMYNDFVIVGPETDPAGVKGMTDAAAALAQIAAAEATFISRGDDSGTHTKEKSVWKAAGIEEPAGDWYVSAGQGMGDVLNMAKEQLAYTLSDRATYLALVKEGLDLVILVEGDPVLFNPYGVIAVNPEKNDQISNDLANQFIDWIISVPTQELIGQFGVADFGAPLFVPNSVLYNEAMGTAQPAESAGAALKITGMVVNEMAWTEAEVQAMATLDVEAPNSKGVMETYTGVSINDLLALAGVDPAATGVVLVADDGFTAEVAIADLRACTTCILSFRSNGGFSSVMPGFDKNYGVKGVVEIQVK